MADKNPQREDSPPSRPPEIVAEDNLDPAMGTMQIGGILNNRNPMAEAHMRHQFQHHPMQMNHSVYGLGHAQMIPPHNPQHVMSQQNAMAYSSMPSLQQEHMIPGYMARHPNATIHDQMDPNNARPRSEPAAKQFTCSTCPKKFARRSDLARHGKIVAQG